MSTHIHARVLDEPVIGEHSRISPSPPPTNSMERILQSLQNFATVSEMLRFLGAGVLVASMSVFLMQGWNEGNDISRYLLLLSQTALLAVAGFALAYGLKETKGARVFFGLALVSVPANFTILSALLYSVLQWDGALGTYPEYATWQITDIANIGLTFGGALIVLIPVTMFCFAIMARRSATWLTAHFLLLNSLLLLPIRSSTTVGMVALLGTVYALYAIGRMIRNDGALRTPEGKFALATLFIPIGILLFRSMYFYQLDSLMIAMLSSAVFLVLRQLSSFPDRNQRLAVVLDLVSLPIALIAASALTDAFTQTVSWEFQAPIFAVAFAAMALDVARRTASNLLATTAGAAVSVLTAASFIFSVSVSTSALGALLCLLAGVTMVLVGRALNDRLAFIAGVLTVLAGAAFGFSDAIDLIFHSSWVELAIFGAASIALGSLLDRHGASLKLRLNGWLNEVGKARQEA
ncbi:MAG: hypothetical protein OES38_10330 [Gammaproteobacteria bacterium]|nr:hypothetical protein [Gammaproteobacteria bacterium]